MRRSATRNELTGSVCVVRTRFVPDPARCGSAGHYCTARVLNRAFERRALSLSGAHGSWRRHTRRPPLYAVPRSCDRQTSSSCGFRVSVTGCATDEQAKVPAVRPWHTSGARRGKGRKLNAQNRRRAGGRNGSRADASSETTRCDATKGPAEVDESARIRLATTMVPNREGDADAQRCDHDISLGVVAIVQGLIPAIEHLDDRPTEADGK
jgi:hypothetical protein